VTITALRNNWEEQLTRLINNRPSWNTASFVPVQATSSVMTWPMTCMLAELTSTQQTFSEIRVSLTLWCVLCLRQNVGWFLKFFHYQNQKLILHKTALTARKGLLKEFPDKNGTEEDWIEEIAYQTGTVERKAGSGRRVMTDWWT